MLLALYLRSEYSRVVFSHGERFEFVLWLGRSREYLITSNHLKQCWVLYKLKDHKATPILIEKTLPELKRKFYRGNEAL